MQNTSLSAFRKYRKIGSQLRNSHQMWQTHGKTAARTGLPVIRLAATCCSPRTADTGAELCHPTTSTPQSSGLQAPGPLFEPGFPGDGGPVTRALSPPQPTSERNVGWKGPTAGAAGVAAGGPTKTPWREAGGPSRTWAALGPGQTSRQQDHGRATPQGPLKRWL